MASSNRDVNIDLSHPLLMFGPAHAHESLQFDNQTGLYDFGTRVMKNPSHHSDDASLTIVLRIGAASVSAGRN
jgi:hypothetical protein